MTFTLVIAEHIQGAVRDSTLECVAAAVQLGQPVSVAVIAAEPGNLSPQVNVEGVTEIIEVPVPAAEFENDTYKEAVSALIAMRGPNVVLTPFSVNNYGYGAAVAVRSDLSFASDVFDLRLDSEQVVAQRGMYGGKVYAEVTLTTPAFLQLRPTSWEPQGGTGEASITEFTVEAGKSRARHREFVESASTGVDITTAPFLLSIGRGIGDEENVSYFDGLANKLGATLSSSRPLVDSGALPKDRQVGQSGKTVKPIVYLALGISGAVQHQAGIKSAGTIIAVNNDPGAAIFSVADFGAVADLYEVASALESLHQ